MLELHNIAYRAKAAHILTDISCRFTAGRVTAIVGPNGAGKTSLLRVAAGLQTPDSGRVTLGDIDFKNPQARARALAYLPQFQSLAWPLLCRDVVALGLLPYGPPDEARVMEALAICGATRFADRPLPSLSGGEAARVHLARLMVADAPVILLDEPTQSLDAAGADAVMAVLNRAAAGGKAVGVVMHDLNLAAHECDEVVVMKAGRIAASGVPQQVFTSDILAPIFGVEFMRLAANGVDYILPQRKLKQPIS